MPAPDPPPADPVADALASPRRSRRGETEVESHGLKETIAAAEYLRRRDAIAARRRRPAIRLNKLRPPGAA